MSINDIRRDVVAIDDSTNDTIYVKSFERDQINRDTFFIDIRNRIEKLPPDLVPLPFIQIKAKEYMRIFKVGDTIDVKLTNRRKIQGAICSFDKETITLVDFSTNKVVIQRKELSGIKSCGVLYARGARFHLFYHCKYKGLDNVKFIKVKQVKVIEKGKYETFEWKE